MKHFLLLTIVLAMVSMCWSQTPDYVPTDGLVGWYSFSGEMSDGSSIGNDAILHGGTWVADRFGNSEAALYLDGQDDYVEIPHGDHLNFGETESFTLAFWWQPDEAITHSGFNGIVGKAWPSGSQPGRGWQVGRTGSTLKCETRGGYSFTNEWDNPPCGFEVPFSAGQIQSPTFVLLEFDREQMVIRISLDGEIVSEEACATLDLPMDNDHPLLLGLEREQNFYSSGHFDDLGIWNRLLSAAEVNALSSGQPLSQIPDYVPTDGLVGWYPFDQNFQDESDFGNDAVENGSVPFTDDRFQNGESALSFSGNGNNFLRVNYSSDSYTFESGFSASVWFISNTTSGNRRVFSMGSTDASGKGFHVMKYSNEIGAWFCEGPGDPYFGNWDGNENTTFDIGEWNHLLFSCDFGNLNWTVFLNGDSVNGGTSGFDFDPNQLPVIFTQTFEIGRKSGTSYSGDAWNGVIDDLGIWSRPLTALEAEALYLSFNGIGGCTDSTACNYDASANWNDGTCLPSGCMDAQACNYNADAECEGEACDYTCCPGPGCCDAGTVWSWESQTCVVAIPAYLNEPGETAILNPCYFDTNYDGLVEVTDLMNLLSVFNMSCFWQCGDRMSYQGYDYETVMIGEQCWFAENLRAENYTNGQPITEVQASADWEQLSSGARAVVGDNGGISVEEYNANLEAFGRIYNGYATMDARGLCPSGWHLPSDADWIQMEMQLGLDEGSANSNGYRGDEGVLLKSSESDSPSWNGNNESGWSGLPGGNRGGIGNFNQVNNYGYWWTSTVEGELDGMPWVFTRSLATDNDAIYRDSTVLTTGNSVRCVQDE